MFDSFLNSNSFTSNNQVKKDVNLKKKRHLNNLNKPTWWLSGEEFRTFSNPTDKKNVALGSVHDATVPRKLAYHQCCSSANA